MGWIESFLSFPPPDPLKENRLKDWAIFHMYFLRDAKLWWRTRYEDIQAGRCVVDTWDDLKRELKVLPENVEFIARRNLRRLQQTGSIREYVKQFSALMLDIRDMSEKEAN
jgi:hypothetical protein